MWWDAFSWLGDIANFIKYLFVPSENYFHNRLSYLNSLCNQKFGGLAQLYQTMNDFFGRLGNPGSAELRFRIPNFGMVPPAFPSICFPAQLPISV